MKRFIFLTVLTISIVMAGVLWVHSDLFAQDPDPAEETIPDDIPFVDRDGDGVNDLLQHGWGLRFRERHKRLREGLENQRENREPFLIDTDNDGEPDTPLREYMRNQMRAKMDELIDTDDDGTPDTPLRDYLRQHHGTFDQDGDGIPDAGTPEQIRQHLQTMRQWRMQMTQQLLEGLNLPDEDGDGWPDGLPQPFRGRGKMHRDENKTTDK